MQELTDFFDSIFRNFGISIFFDILSNLKWVFLGIFIFIVLGVVGIILYKKLKIFNHS